MNPGMVIGTTIAGVATGAMLISLQSIRSWVKSVNMRLSRIEAHLKIGSHRE